MTHRTKAGLFTLLTAAAIAAMMVGCGKQSSITSPEVGSPANVISIEALRSTMAVQDRHTAALLRMPGVVGTATGVDAAGKPVIMVLTETKLPSGHLPAALEGVGVIEEVTGKIVAVKGGGGGVSHTAIQTPPIQLGTSG